jgi:hypothetical protein
VKLLNTVVVLLVIAILVWAAPANAHQEASSDDRHPETIRQRMLDAQATHEELKELQKKMQPKLVGPPEIIPPECLWGQYWPRYYEVCGVGKEQIPPIAIPPTPLGRF